MNPSETDIVNRLIEFGETVGANELVFNNDPLVGDLVKNDPFAFLMGASVDRGMAAETAWRLPGKLRESLGHLDPSKIAAMTSDDMLAALNNINGKPRYLTAASKTLVEVADHVVNRYGGDASSLWRDQSAATIQRRMEDIYGVGPGIASMVVILLDTLNEVSLLPEDYAGMDPKPDVHVQRVFQRLGFCGRDPTEKDVIVAARRVYPTYPGKLDGPAWYIGRKWCRPEKPNCPECPMHDPCPKVL